MFNEVNGLTVLVEDETELVWDEVEVDMPYKYDPYPFQQKAWDAKKEGMKNFIFVWHRRAGKDKTLWNMFVSFIVDEWETPGLYLYCLPTAASAKLAVWQNSDLDGFRLLDHIPKELVDRKLENEMTVHLTNGSIIKLVGSDNYDRLVGSNPRGVVFSEYSVGNPLGWEFLKPAIKRGGGWALFPYTPRAKNHGWELIEGAKRLNAHRLSKGLKPEWFIQIETVETTTDHNGNRLYDDNYIEEERLLGMSEDMIQQEYYCSFDAAITGAIYGEQIRKVNSEERVTFIPIEPNLPVYVSADIGRSDAACWWFIQFKGEQIRFVHYYENTLKDTEHFINYIDEFKQTNNVRIDTVILPHDAKHKTMNAPISVEAKFKKAGYKVAIASPPAKVSREEGIQQVRALFCHFWFNEQTTKLGYQALTSYIRRYDELTKVFSKEPKHDWASNGSDAMRMFAVWYREDKPQHQRKAPVRRKAQRKVNW
ncbi:MAG TPA: hypothetical protein EYN67_04350 [Flavobacteriales bacterium]|nr:hypothetical protein [Flavobacteriales bacterium]